MKTGAKDLAKVAAGAALAGKQVPVEFSEDDDWRLRWGFAAEGVATGIKILPGDAVAAATHVGRGKSRRPIKEPFK
ncbi:MULTISPECIES: hypothetical protein [unclassified Caballeronia]|uniref:hypothetical protein n=1 Tax=unclassified Caballeronia TaxID=2646786 RepID=UPI003ED0F2DE